MNTSTRPTIPLNTNFFANAFARAHQDREAASGRDNAALHVSDLTGCARAVWARRAGKEMIQPDDDTMRKFAFGKGFEVQVLDALIASGHRFTKEYAFSGYEASGIDLEITGHVDFVLWADHDKTEPAAVIEVKTTTFFPTRVGDKRVRVAPAEADIRYRIQAAAYALLIGAPRFCVVVCCRESGMMASFWFETSRYADLVRERIAKIAPTSDPARREPVDAVPPRETINARTGKSWMCSYCNYAACERNINPAALAVPA